MSNPNLNRVAEQLTALGLPVPPATAEALAALNAAYAHEAPVPVDLNFAAMACTAEEVPGLIDSAREASIRIGQHNVVRGELIDRLERRGVRTLAADTDEILTALEPTFRTAAEAFMAAYDELPSAWADAEQLVREGPGAVTTLLQAQQQIPPLDACRSIRHSLPIDYASRIAEGTTYLAVADTLIAEEAANVRADGSLGLWGNLLGLDGNPRLQWHATLDAHRAYVETLPKFEMRQQRIDNNGFSGHQLVKTPVGG